MPSTYKSKDALTVPTNEEVLFTPTYNRLWMVMHDIVDTNRISKRELPDIISIEIARYQGDFVDAYGKQYHLPEIDDVFDLPDCRSLRDYFEEDICENKPKRKTRRCDRLRYFSLFIMILRPKLWTLIIN